MPLPVKPFKIEREWVHAGLDCAVVQAREGMHRCGYVRVPSNHPAYNVDYNNVEADVHGGLTFGQADDEGNGWWFGFDCAHFGDSMFDLDSESTDPSFLAVRKVHIDIASHFPDSQSREHFWKQDEVERETEELAVQLAAMSICPACGNPAGPHDCAAILRALTRKAEG